VLFVGKDMHPSGDKDRGRDAPSIKQFFEEYSRELKNISENDLIVRPELTSQVTSLAEKNEAGLPFFAFLEAPFNDANLYKFAGRLEALLFSHLSDFFHNFISGLSFPGEQSNPVTLLARCILKGEGAFLTTLAKTKGVPVDVLAFFAVYLVRPIRAQVRQVFEEHYHPENWRYGYCPVCGLWPRLARFEPESGRRRLWCIGCDGQWSFPRMVCPFCLEDSQDKLGYLTVEGWPGYRLHTCETCRRYIKTRDERERNTDGTSNSDIDYMATSILDSVATQEKYIKDFVGFTAFDMQDSESFKSYRNKLHINKQSQR